MGFLQNLDLLSVGITTAGIGLLGFAIFINNSKSATNRAFLYFSIAAILWSLTNYFSYQVTNIVVGLILLRLVIFFALWLVFFLFNLFFIFPNEKVKFPTWYIYFLVPTICFTSLLTLTPFVVTKISKVTATGHISSFNHGAGLILFGIIVFCLVVSSVILFLYKTIKSTGIERKQYLNVLIGFLITFLLLLTFNFIAPAFFNNPSFIPLGAIFIFPIIALTSYSVYKHKLFEIKNIVTVLVAFALTIVTFVEIIFADSLILIIFRVSIFILVLIFSIQLIKNMFNLEVANERLKEVDAMKTEFVSLATHQIRAPLTAIKGYLSLIQEGDYGPVSTDVSRALDIIYQSTNNLVTIVGDFLDVSRIEQNRMKYDFSDFDLKKLVEQIVAEYKPNVEKKGLEFHYAAAPGNYMVHADLGKVKQVIGNIIDNSIKYTPKGRIDVSLATNYGKILIEVADTGVGIPVATMPKLFQKFTRAENANEANILGTGLGLYVAKQMVEAHHGRIWAESEGPNKGSQFYIELSNLDEKNRQYTITDMNPFAAKK